MSRVFLAEERALGRSVRAHGLARQRFPATRQDDVRDAQPLCRCRRGVIRHRQPREAHDFFVKYQDQILFGKDSYQPENYPYYWRVFETNDDYFDYYRPYHAVWKLYGIGLPDEVLKRVYSTAMR
jgi:hypothetical protein